MFLANQTILVASSHKNMSRPGLDTANWIAPHIRRSHMFDWQAASEATFVSDRMPPQSPSS